MPGIVRDDLVNGSIHHQKSFSCIMIPCTFASDRLGGLGGLDIYKSFVNAEGEWQPPINLKSPINSNEG